MFSANVPIPSAYEMPVRQTASPGRMRQLRKDIQLAANVAAIALALSALAVWALSWPSTLISRVLLLVGAGTILLGYSIATTTALAAVPGWRRLPVLACVVFLGAIVVIAMLALPLLTSIIGAFVLINLLVFGLVKLAPRVYARYRPARSDPGPLARTTPPHAP